MSNPPQGRTWMLLALLAGLVLGTPARAAEEPAPVADPAAAAEPTASTEIVDEEPGTDAADAARPKSRKELEAEKRQKRVRPHVARSFAKVRGYLDAEDYAAAEEELADLHTKT